MDSSGDGHMRAESGESRGGRGASAALPRGGAAAPSTTTARPKPAFDFADFATAAAAAVGLLPVDSAPRVPCVSGWDFWGTHWERAASTVSITRQCASVRSLAFRRRSRGLTKPSSYEPGLIGPDPAGLALGLKSQRGGIGKSEREGGGEERRGVCACVRHGRRWTEVQRWTLTVSTNRS